MSAAVTAGVDFPVADDLPAIRRAIARHLPANGLRVVDCRVVRSRTRPGARRLVQYAVTLEQTGGRRHEARVTGHWHADAGRAAHHHRRASRLAATLAGTWTAALPAAFVDAGTGMLATTFPCDLRLPTLPVVVAGDAPAIVGPMLAAMGVAAADVRGVTVDTVRYREHLNAVCRYTVHRRLAGPDARFYVKVYADDGGARAAAHLATVARVTARDPGAAQVSRAVAYVPSVQALVLAEAPGTPLDALTVPRPALATMLARVATALARFGAATAAALPVRDAAGRLEAGRRAAATIGAGLPDVAATVDRLVAAAAARLADGEATLTHGDLKLEHVLIGEEAVRLIDLDSCHLGDARWDLALLEARVWAAADRDGDTARGDWSRRTLAAAYFGDGGRWRAAGLGALRTLACLDVAAGVLKRHEPGAGTRARRLVREAGHHLEA